MPVVTAEAPMRPGTYLQKRREAALLSVRDVALLMADDLTCVAEVVQRIEEAESDEKGLHGGFAGKLHNVFSFDLEVYLILAALRADPKAEIPLPQICRECGCTWHDACWHPDHGSCAWVDGDPTLCTHCSDVDHPEAGIVFAVADVNGDECPDCGGDLGPVFGTTASRTCRSCETTFIGAGETSDA